MAANIVNRHGLCMRKGLCVIYHGYQGVEGFSMKGACHGLGVPTLVTFDDQDSRVRLGDMNLSGEDARAFTGVCVLALGLRCSKCQ